MEVLFGKGMHLSRSETHGLRRGARCGSWATRTAGLAKGWTYKQLAAELSISIDTIRTYIRRIYEKLHVQSRTEAVAKYLRP